MIFVEIDFFFLKIDLKSFKMFNELPNSFSFENVLLRFEYAKTKNMRIFTSYRLATSVI